MPRSPIDLLVPLIIEPPDLSVLQDDAYWKTVRDNAGRYGVAALVAYAARSHVSPMERVWCDRVLTDSWTRHERMLGHLEFVLSLLEDEGIPAISLKGPLLAQRYYTPAFLRKPAMDLDVAVTGRDLARATNALINAGYILVVPIGESLARSHHVTLSHPSRPRVELHFRLSHMALGLPVDQFFGRTVSCPLPNGREARVLGPADQLLHLVLHLATSRFGTLFHLYEIRRAFRTEPPGVRAEAIQRAVDHHFCGVLRMVDLAFRVRWGVPLFPPEIEIPGTWLKWRLNEKLYEKFEQWSTPGNPLTLLARLQGRWLDFQITDAPSDALRSIKLLAQTARFRILKRAWGNIQDLTYGPDYTAR